MLRKIGLALVLCWVARLARAVVLEGVGYADDASAGEAWQPQGESPRAKLFMDGSLKRSLVFQAPFATLKDWRVYWDLPVQADLSADAQILVSVRSPDPSAISQGILFFHSGAGWYRLPAFSVSGDWTEVVLSKAQAATEDQPSGWDKVDKIRLSFLPGEKRDTSIELSGISTRGGWPLAYLGAVGGYQDLSASAAAFRLAAKGQPQAADVEARLLQAQALLASATAASDPDQRQALILKGREQVAQAYALIQSPREDEFRCVWVHTGDGVRAQGGARVQRWKEALPQMKAQGYNAVAANMLWSGVAYYPSKIVPNAPGVATEGDYLQELVDAAKPLGMQVHVWKVMWQFSEGWLAPAGVSEPFRRQGRLQMDAQGKELPWLCPCDERNRKYELDAIKEVAKNYAIDGIHLDYIRWDGDKGSFTPMCRERFEKWSKQKVAAWPQDVLAGGSRQGQWQDFKRDVITSFVREVRQALKKIKPQLQLSAAVFPDAGIARNAVFQDWPRWVQEGLVDWVSTMTYNEDAAGFKATVTQQKALMAPGVKLRPGMEFTYDGGRVLALDAAVDEIKALRDLGLDGFAVFEWRDHLQDSVGPYLRAGLLRSGPYQPVATFERALPAYARPAQAQKGRPLDLKAGKDGSVLLDDFEDGNLANEAQGSWILDADSNKLGTVAGPQPLQAQAGGAHGSKYYLGFKGHYGKAQAPWPYATLLTYLNPDHAPVDLSAFKGLGFYARGDGKAYEVVLHEPVVKDFAYFRARFQAGKDWAPVSLDWKAFKQPGWGQPVESDFGDVDQLQFGPSGLSDEDFGLDIDDVRFVR
jgi:uncharacterized lipoprotein YddW (UPF0748 family)